MVGAHGAVRDMLRAEGLGERVGEVNRRVALDDVVRAFRAQPPPCGSAGAAGQPPPSAL
jgi:hypothetical protein